MNLFFQPRIPEGDLFLDAEESKHCTRVLRKKAGDEILVTDGKGTIYRAQLVKTDPAQCTFRIVSSDLSSQKKFHVHIAIAPTKNADRIEWFVEKSTEIGIDAITLLECENSERVKLRMDRLSRLAISAMKQSLHANLPALHAPVPFNRFLGTVKESHRFIAHVDSGNPVHLQRAAPPSGDYVVLIGPEGDFSAAELSMAERAGFVKVSLGPSRLRTETAGLAACHILNLVNAL